MATTGPETGLAPKRRRPGGPLDLLALAPGPRRHAVMIDFQTLDGDTKISRDRQIIAAACRTKRHRQAAGGSHRNAFCTTRPPGQIDNPLLLSLFAGQHTNLAVSTSFVQQIEIFFNFRTRNPRTLRTNKYEAFLAVKISFTSVLDQS